MMTKTETTVEKKGGRCHKKYQYQNYNKSIIFFFLFDFLIFYKSFFILRLFIFIFLPTYP